MRFISYSTTYVCTGRRSSGGVLITDISRTPTRDIWSVRGIGVALKVRTSILLAHSFHFSFCATPKRCSSSTTRNPKSLNFTFLFNKECVPINMSIDPFSTPFRTSFFSAVERNRLSTSTFTPNGLNRFRNVW